MRPFHDLKRLWTVWKRRPVVDIVQHGQLTPRPQVTVGLASRGGLISLYTYPDDDAGNAHASMNGQSVAHILGLHLNDRRAPPQPTEGSGS